jgi:hypothetical protein
MTSESPRHKERMALLKSCWEVPGLPNLLIGKNYLSMNDTVSRAVKQTGIDKYVHIDREGVISGISPENAKRLCDKLGITQLSLSTHLYFKQWLRLNHPDAYEPSQEPFRYDDYEILGGKFEMFSPKAGQLIFPDGSSHLIKNLNPEGSEEDALFSLEDTIENTGYPKRFRQNGEFRLCLPNFNKLQNPYGIIAIAEDDLTEIDLSRSYTCSDNELCNERIRPVIAID